MLISGHSLYLDNLNNMFSDLFSFTNSLNTVFSIHLAWFCTNVQNNVAGTGSQNATGSNYLQLFCFVLHSILHIEVM